MKENLSLVIYTLDKQIELNDLDSIHLNIADDVKGKFSGSYGIKKGHTNAVFSLKAGVITAYAGGKQVFSAETTDGFGIMENGTLSLTFAGIETLS